LYGLYGCDFDGVVVIYVQVVSRFLLYWVCIEVGCILVIFDEIYYGGDVLFWGDVVCEVFEFARCCFVLIGILFCSDTVVILFVMYVEDGDGVWRSQVDYMYGYGDVLCDGVVWFVIFLVYLG